MFSFSFRTSNHVILLLLGLVLSINAYVLDSYPHYGRFDMEERSLGKRDIADRVPLRILCIGASVTYGFTSPDGNGYRYALRGKLVADGNDVNMVGSRSAGNMSDNQVEAWPGQRIAQVAAKAKSSYVDNPNLVLIFLGTNDMAQNFEVATAHLRLADMIAEIYDDVPTTMILVAKLLPNRSPVCGNNTLIYNANLDLTVQNFTEQGRKIVSVDMHSDWFTLDDIGPDGTHPTEFGYLKMARVWYTGIVEAARAGNITAPPAAPSAAGGLIDDFAAGNDSSAAGTAMDVVCQTPADGNVTDVQKQQCAVSGAQTTMLNISAAIGALLVMMSQL